jgi:CHASE2 domain-containing sensor protein
MEEKELIRFVGGMALVVAIPIGYLVIKGNPGFRTAEALLYIAMGLMLFIAWLSGRRHTNNITILPALLATGGCLLMGLRYLVPVGQYGWLDVVAPLVFFTGMMLALIIQRRMAR